MLRYLIPDLDVEQVRRSIDILVPNVFLPALVFRVIYTARLGAEAVQIPVMLLLSVVVCLAVATYALRLFRLSHQEPKALVLASAFGNVTYLGLRVLQGLHAVQLLKVAKVAILCEITTTPRLRPLSGPALQPAYRGPAPAGNHHPSVAGSDDYQHGLGIQQAGCRRQPGAGRAAARVPLAHRPPFTAGAGGDGQGIPGSVPRLLGWPG